MTVNEIYSWRGEKIYIAQTIALFEDLLSNNAKYRCTCNNHIPTKGKYMNVINFPASTFYNYICHST